MPLDFPPFRPHPLVRGGHLQTILGCYLPGQVQVLGVQRRVPLWDGDEIVLHDDGPSPSLLAGTKPGPGAPLAGSDSDDRELLTPGYCDGKRYGSSDQNWQSGDPVAILIHGLGGCHQSGYMRRCSEKLRARGVRVFRMDLRGCGAGAALARNALHAGRSEDAAAALAFVVEHCPDSPVHLVGFSMGANIVLKLAGELGSDVPPNLASVMAVAPPIDLVECSRNMQRGLNRYYDRTFVRGLVQHVRRREQLVPDALSRPLVPHPRKLVEFDSLFTAPLSGFADVNDYYTRASSGPLLAKITVPALVIAAASDPIVPVLSFEQASFSPTTQLIITPCGGHLGFIAASGPDPDRRWIDWRVVEWIESQATSSALLPHLRRQAAARTAIG